MSQPSRWFLVPLALLALLPLAVTVPAHAQAPAGKHCVQRAKETKVSCYDTLTKAIAAATGGRVSDAPADPAKAMNSARLRRELESPAAKAAGARAAGADTVVGIIYRDYDFGGASLTMVGYGTCTANRSAWFARLFDPWNDAVSSFKTYNDCMATFYEHWDGQGERTQMMGGAWTGMPDGWNDRASGVLFSEGPSITRLLKDCGNAAGKCEFTPKGQPSYWTKGAEQVAWDYNCTKTNQTHTMSFEHTTGGENSVSTEISVTAGFDFLTKFEVQFKASYGHRWSWSDTFRDTPSQTVRPFYIGRLTRAVPMQTGQGDYDMWYPGKMWGHYNWKVFNFWGTGPVPQKAGTYGWHEEKMSTASKKQLCGSAKSAARDAGVQRTTSTKGLPELPDTLRVVAG
ncbi:hypothetical protein [Actinomadura macrotermitis]|uniref:Uncharacterized protein n=1 Tax=Actinomadura macrotermitis TaxID=2585200 RepID=A0A7K0BNA5_9ACTN|nr:hypothetical protein [Actinomadura macrotermitis]MQY02670.1 hypothetical protein [Actinomadura macrotermitis]